MNAWIPGWMDAWMQHLVELQKDLPCDLDVFLLDMFDCHLE